MKYFSGIGSRRTPPTIQRIMMYIARDLDRDGYTLRSGNAYGADDAFARGVEKNAQIWLPWKDYNLEYQEERPSHEYKVITEDDQEAFDSINHFHPNGPNLKESARKLMARNYRIVKGWRDPNSEFVIYWTDGDLGGTGQALRIAKHYDIPTFNLLNMTKDEIFKEIKKLHLIY